MSYENGSLPAPDRERDPGSYEQPYDQPAPVQMDQPISHYQPLEQENHHQQHLRMTSEINERNTDSGHYEEPPHYEKVNPPKQRYLPCKHVVVVIVICLTLVTILMVITFTVLKTQGYLSKNHDNTSIGRYIVNICTCSIFLSNNLQLMIIE